VEAKMKRPVTGDSGDEFDDEAAQEYFDDFMVSLPNWIWKTLAVSLMCYFQKRQKLNVKDSALETVYFTGFYEKTVCTYRNNFFSNKLNQNKASIKDRAYLMMKTSSKEASMWVRENTHKKGGANMTAATFCQLVNNELLPSVTLPANFPGTISLRTATRWLHRLGFRPVSHKKGAYMDGHERDDVVAYRKEYLKSMHELCLAHNPSPPCSDERAVTPPDDAEFKKKLVLIFQHFMKASIGLGVLQINLSKGAGIMVSDYIEQHGGFLRLMLKKFVWQGILTLFPRQLVHCWSMVVKKKGIGRLKNSWLNSWLMSTMRISKMKKISLSITFQALVIQLISSQSFTVNSIL
jgi:hypothetical protein